MNTLWFLVKFIASITMIILIIRKLVKIGMPESTEEKLMKLRENCPPLIYQCEVATKRCNKKELLKKIKQFESYIGTIHNLECEEEENCILEICKENLFVTSNDIKGILQEVKNALEEENLDTEDILKKLEKVQKSVLDFVNLGFMRLEMKESGCLA